MPVNNQKNQNDLNIFLNNYFNIIIVFIVIIMLLISYFAVIKPKYDETMTAIQDNIDQQQKLYAEQEKKLIALRTVSDLYKKIPQADLKKFNSVLPDNFVKERLFGELEEIVTQNGFKVDSIEIFDEKKIQDAESSDPNFKPTLSPKIGEVKLQMSISAIDYAGLKNLLTIFENNLRLFDVSAVSFSPGGNTAQITLSTYYYKK